VNFPDVLIIQNKYQFKPPLPFSPGSELSGVVKEIGEEEDAARNSEGLNNAVNNPPEQPQNRRIEVTLGA
jgi:NADPH:quinone reductase-like Zn-dependent oxidoreductase